MNGIMFSHKTQKRIFAIVGIIALLIGLATLIIGLFSVMHSAEVEAVITDVSRSGRKTAYVSYTYEAKEYEDIPTGFYSSTMEVGDMITIQVDKASPDSIVNTYFFFIFGGVFAFIGVIFLIVGKFSGRGVSTFASAEITEFTE